MSGWYTYFHTKLSKLFVRHSHLVELEDTVRRAFILRVLLGATITLLAMAMASSVLTSLTATDVSRENNALSLIGVGILLAGFVGLFVLARTRHVRSVSFVFIGILILFTLYLALRWGADLPAAMLLYGLCIVISGILVSSRFSLLVTAAIALAVYLIHYLHTHQYVAVNGYWRTEQLTGYDVVVIAVMLGVVATVSWLSNREIEKSLVRARTSEALLKEERDQLEVRVSERTQELRQVELERMSQAYRFVEFGRLASGIFHDLVNPLTALALNIERIEKGAGTASPVSAMTEDIARARSATTHMQALMDSMRRHLAREGVRVVFALREVLDEARVVLDTYARQRSVQLTHACGDDFTLEGDPVACMQVITNLVTNAIEACEGVGGTVHIACEKVAGRIRMSITDTGSGIAPQVQERIFEPFFSTKSARKGLGIGLSLSLRIVEKEFGGRIEVSSTQGSGTVVTVYF